jgi:hypothetical protein
MARIVFSGPHIRVHWYFAGGFSHKAGQCSYVFQRQGCWIKLAICPTFPPALTAEQNLLKENNIIVK